MAADVGSNAFASQVCVACKARKKKCDKLLPSCGYCIRRKLTCEYQLHDPQPRNEKQSILPAVYTQSIPSEPVVAEASLYRHVIQLIHESGHFVDDLSTHYFQGMHRYLPVCSRPHFYSNLITLGAIPPAGFSVLLLTICLTASATHADRLTLRSTVNYLVTLVQESFPVSIPLIQSRILLAIYDYTNGRPEDAFQAIAGCARMAYTARLHRHFLPACQSDAEIQANSDAPEEANTWWGIIICERMFFCEVAVREQPLVTTIPDGDVLLPTDPESLRPGDCLRQETVSIHKSSTSVSCIDSPDVGGFGRAAQAAWLLDQVFKTLGILSLHSRLVRLQSLDAMIQNFLGLLIQQCSANERPTSFCQPIAITIRALFIMHTHISGQTLPFIDQDYPLLENWRQRSPQVLDTVSKMVLDIVEAHGKSDLVPPSYSYIIQAALQHVCTRPNWEDDSTLQNAEERLRISLHYVNTSPRET